MTRHEEIRRLHFHLQAAFFYWKNGKFLLAENPFESPSFRHIN